MHRKSFSPLTRVNFRGEFLSDHALKDLRLTHRSSRPIEKYYCEAMKLITIIIVDGDNYIDRELAFTL